MALEQLTGTAIKRTGFDWNYVYLDEDGQRIEGTVFGLGCQVTMDEIYDDAGLNKEDGDIIYLARSDFK